MRPVRTSTDVAGPGPVPRARRRAAPGAGWPPRPPPTPRRAAVTARRSRRAPSRRRTGQRAVGPGVHLDQPERLGEAEVVRQEGRHRAGPAVVAEVAAHHGPHLQVGRTQHGGHDLRGALRGQPPGLVDPHHPLARRRPPAPTAGPRPPAGRRTPAPPRCPRRRPGGAPPPPPSGRRGRSRRRAPRGTTLPCTGSMSGRRSTHFTQAATGPRRRAVRRGHERWKTTPWPPSG